jgi:hypothetical protein
MIITIILLIGDGDIISDTEIYHAGRRARRH